MKIMFETERLIIRETCSEDFENLKAVISDPINMKYYPKPYDDNGVNRWLNWCINSYKENGFGLWALILKENGDYIGDCGISLQNIDGEIVPEVGYHLNYKYHHKGYIYEACQAVIEFGFTKLGFNKLYSYMTSENIPSQCVAIRNNMIFEKSYVSDATKDFVFSITKEYWESLKNRKQENTYNRIILIGPPGAGKSHLAKELSAISDLPLYHLDKLYWKENWAETPRNEFIEIQKNIVKQDKWIIDGSYSSTLKYRIEKCDTVILMDFDIEECLENEKSRRGIKRSDLPDYLEETYDPTFEEYIKQYPYGEMKLLKAYMFAHSNKNVIVLHNRQETNDFLNNFKK